jgi:hypothetical protein
MPKLPAEVLRALRDAEANAATQARLDRVAASIVAAAAPLLAERRRAKPAWWDLPAAWAATLIPISLVLSAASILVLWRVQPPRPDREIAQASVDQAINALVTTPPR